MSTVTNFPLRMRITVLRCFDARTGAGAVVAILFQPAHQRGYQPHCQGEAKRPPEKGSRGAV